MNFNKIAKWIDDNSALAVDLQTKLTATKALAPESDGDGEMEKCLLLEDWLRSHKITDLVRFDAPDDRVSCGKRPSLVATIKGKQTKALWIMAHLDVVPEGDLSLWKTPPYEVHVEGDKLIGRGVEDNQQGLVSAAMMAAAFADLEIVPELTVKLLFVADEEVGSIYGIQYLLRTQNLFSKDDLIVIPDGGDEKGADIEVAEKHMLWLEFRTVGKQAHGSRPDEGCNAHLANCFLALEINGLEQVFPKRNPIFAPDYSTFQPTKKNANVPNINTIPGDDVFCADCRILPCYTLDEVRSEIQKCVKKTEEKYGVTITVEEKQSVQSPATPEDAPVVKALTAAVKSVYDVDAKTVGIGGGTVASYLRNAGFHAVVWSRMADTAHQPNEYCLLSNLLGDAKVFAKMVL